MKLTQLRRAGILALAGTALLAAPSVARADAGACGSTSASNGCTGWTASGGTAQYRFSVSDGNLSNNEYIAGFSVDDRVGSLKKGTTTYVRFCAWSDPNAGGAVRGYSTSTTTWTNPAGADSSSVYLRTTNNC